jgi:hypothetical protein
LANVPTRLYQDGEHCGGGDAEEAGIGQKGDLAVTTVAMSPAAAHVSAGVIWFFKGSEASHTNDGLCATPTGMVVVNPAPVMVCGTAALIAIGCSSAIDARRTIT